MKMKTKLLNDAHEGNVEYESRHKRTAPHQLMLEEATVVTR
jgi:hypothetical protein